MPLGVRRTVSLATHAVHIVGWPSTVYEVSAPSLATVIFLPVLVPMASAHLAALSSSHLALTRMRVCDLSKFAPDEMTIESRSFR